MRSELTLCFHSLVLFLIYYPKELRYERAISLPGRTRRPGATDGDVSDDSSGGWSDEVEDIDSLGSHFADNYSGVNVSGVSASGVEGLPTESAVQRFQDDHIRGHDDEVSSSAFARLVPTFWPMWKAPPGSGQAGRPGAPAGRAGATYTPPGAASPSGLQAPRGDGSNLLRNALDNAQAQQNTNNATNNAAMRAWKKSIRRKTKRRTAEWSLSIGLAWVVLLHL